jgi:hypothetical protein
MPASLRQTAVTRTVNPWTDTLGKFFSACGSGEILLVVKRLELGQSVGTSLPRPWQPVVSAWPARSAGQKVHRFGNCSSNLKA